MPGDFDITGVLLYPGVLLYAWSTSVCLKYFCMPRVLMYPQSTYVCLEYFCIPELLLYSWSTSLCLEYFCMIEVIFMLGIIMPGILLYTQSTSVYLTYLSTRLSTCDYPVLCTLQLNYIFTNSLVILFSYLDYQRPRTNRTIIQEKT